MARVVIGLSGGVDSSVAAYLLKAQGHEVIGLFMINWHDTTGTLEGDCPWRDDRVFAELVAKKLDIALHVVDLSGDYRTRVVEYMFAEYEKGRTPNPDVLCNREIKFDVFLHEALKLGAEFVATGHYCRKTEETLPDGQVVHKLLAGADPNKDQSYFLCQLSQEQLRYALFPVGELLKPEVRQIAAEQSLATAKRKDSQGICFVGKVDLPTFLQQKLASKKGNIHEILPAWSKYMLREANGGTSAPDDMTGAVRTTADALSSAGAQAAAATEAFEAGGVCGGTPAHHGTSGVPSSGISGTGISDTDVSPNELSSEQLAALAAPWRYTVRDGKKIGEHGGAHFYTIGQRKGLGIGGRKESLFILATDTEQNVIYVGEGDSHPGLWRRALYIKPDEVHWVNPARTLSAGQSGRFSVRIRYRQPLQGAELVVRNEGAYIVFDEPQRGIAPGQFAAWYDGDELVGSGVIAE
ncbi:tRNA 2-thiouridine(34) synthase MnmA [uncultured Alistipes sp.]|uniref:tRNA 2-thiouridine(34) synthase MnmA n=1 Tax=uncultured Alistipes sp. TaxID=538949 RepID=UPI0025D59D3B|nr:tRNA 2-thiouridine(34) synthase MnmA [uncultured Alistipes sp.]